MPEKSNLSRTHTKSWIYQANRNVHKCYIFDRWKKKKYIMLSRMLTRCFSFFFHFSSCEGKNENRYNGSYFYFSFSVCRLGKGKRYQVLGSTSIPARLDTLVYWEPFSWLTSVGTTRNTVIRLGWSRIGLAVLILHAAGVGLTDRPAVISGRYNKCHSLQLQNYFAHLPPLQHTHTFMQTQLCGTGHGNDHGFRGIVCWPWQEESCVIG